MDTLSPSGQWGPWESIQAIAFWRDLEAMASCRRHWKLKLRKLKLSPDATCAGEAADLHRSRNPSLALFLCSALSSLQHTTQTLPVQHPSAHQTQPQGRSLCPPSLLQPQSPGPAQQSGGPTGNLLLNGRVKRLDSPDPVQGAWSAGIFHLSPLGKH